MLFFVLGFKFLLLRPLNVTILNFRLIFILKGLPDAVILS